MNEILLNLVRSHSAKVNQATSLGFLAGLIQLFLGLIRGGGLLELISSPVLAGFINVSALSIAALQLPKLLGADVFGESMESA